MDAFVVDVTKGALGALIVAWLGYHFWLKQHLRGLRQSYDLELRTARFKAYGELWHSFGPFALFSPDHEPIYADVDRLGREMRRWYFSAGGLYLTERARDVYFTVQEVLTTMVAAGAAPETSLARPAKDILRTVDRLRDQLGLAPLQVDTLARAPALAAWCDGARKRAAGWAFGVALNDFILVQWLASSLRTALITDLRSRNAALLDQVESEE